MDLLRVSNVSKYVFTEIMTIQLFTQKQQVFGLRITITNYIILKPIDGSQTFWQ